jgi:hypothetical protein
MTARKAETYPTGTHVIDLAELRQIIWDLQHESEQDKKKGAYLEHHATRKPGGGREERWSRRTTLNP